MADVGRCMVRSIEISPCPLTIACVADRRRRMWQPLTRVGRDQRPAFQSARPCVSVRRADFPGRQTSNTERPMRSYPPQCSGGIFKERILLLQQYTLTGECKNFAIYCEYIYAAITATVRCTVLGTGTARRGTGTCENTSDKTRIKLRSTI